MRKLAHTPVRTFAALAAGLAMIAAPAAVQQADAQEAGPSQEQARVIKVKILGMSCPFCAYGAKQKLQELDGVKELNIELESGLATLTMKAGADVPNEKLKKTVDSAGFEAAAIVRNFPSEHEDWHPEKIPGEESHMKKVALEVTGMKCEGCASAVDAALDRVDGVRRVDVSLDDGRAVVVGDDGLAADELVAAVEDAGYGASPGG